MRALSTDDTKELKLLAYGNLGKQDAQVILRQFLSLSWNSPLLDFIIYEYFHRRYRVIDQNRFSNAEAISSFIAITAALEASA